MFLNAHKKKTKKRISIAECEIREIDEISTLFFGNRMRCLVVKADFKKHARHSGAQRQTTIKSLSLSEHENNLMGYSPR